MARLGVAGFLRLNLRLHGLRGAPHGLAAAVLLFAASDLFVKALVRTESLTTIIAVLNVILTVGMATVAW